MSEYLCKDCKHSFRPVGRILAWGFDSPYTYMCKLSYKPDRQEPDKVVGSKFIKGGYETCNLARMNIEDNTCGREAKFWQPKEKKGLFKLIVKES